MEIRKGLEQIFKRLYFRQNEEQSWNLKFGTFCTVFSADTFDEWQIRPVPFQAVGSKGDPHCNCNQK